MKMVEIATTDGTRVGNNEILMTFEKLATNHYADLLVYASSLCQRNKAMAEEITQEALITAFEKFDSFDQSKSFATWVRGIMRFKRLQAIQKRKEKVSIDDITLCVEEIDDDPLLDLKDKAGSEKKLFGILRESLNKLSKTTKAVLEMFYFQNKSIDVIANTLGINVGTAQKRLERGRNDLRNVLTVNLTNVYVDRVIS